MKSGRRRAPSPLPLVRKGFSCSEARMAAKDVGSVDR
jgi:hypothetical protein